MTVEPLASTEKYIVVSASAAKAPKEGAVLCLTPIPFPADGARVLPTIDGQPMETPAGGPKPSGDNNTEKRQKPSVVSQKADT